MDKALIQRLKAAHKDVATVRLGNGAQLLCLPYGGRILGLFAKGSSQNFYWTNPVLRKSPEALHFFASDAWQNTGGERTWLGPEYDYFFPKYPDMSEYRPPRVLDAGLYKVKALPDGVRLSSQFVVRSNVHRAPVTLSIRKEIRPAADPLRGWTPRREMTGLEYAGYSECIALRIIRTSKKAVEVGLWSITQMPQGGKMIVPTIGKADYRVFFGSFDQGDLELHPGGVCWRMWRGAHAKIGVKALSVFGRLGYLYEQDSKFHLVVKSFPVDLSGKYIDAPWSDQSDAGYCVQMCNVTDADLGTFSELEYHVPAIGGSTGTTRRESCSQTWAYRGSRKQIEQIAKKLLGVSAA